MSMANTRVMEAACFLLGNVASSQVALCPSNLRRLVAEVAMVQEGLLHISRNKGGAVALKVRNYHVYRDYFTWKDDLAICCVLSIPSCCRFPAAAALACIGLAEACSLVLLHSVCGVQDVLSQYHSLL